VINRARPISDFANETVEVEPQQQQALPTVRQGTLYLRLPTEQTPLFGKVRAILNMFPGESNAVVYFADTKQRRGTRCALDERMIKELKNVLSEANVVIK
jgi:DNA polymerase-3 subunit alpha